MANIHQTMGETAYTNAQNRLAAIPAGDAGSYAKWYDTFSPAYKGMNLPTPEQWAQDTNGQLKGHMIATSESARALAKPEVLDVGGVKTRYVPGTGTAQEIGITPFAPQGADTGAGAGTGPATAAMNPDRLAAMQATQARLGLPPMQPSAAGANAAVNNMPSVPVALPVGAPVNNMPGVPVPDAGVKNAMRAGPIGAGEFARQQQEEADRRALVQEGLKTEARKQAELNVATPEAERLKNVGKQEFQGSLAAMVDQYKDLGRQGVLIEKGTSLGQRALTFAGAQAPGLAGVVSPEVGGPMQTLTNMRSTLLTGLMAATGMSSKQIDSNKEMQNYLDAMTSPGQTVKTITDTFNELSRKYGTGQTIKPEDISPPKSSSGIPSGRRSAAPVKPTERPPLSSFGG
jgi:hypothetical protein